MPKAEVSVASLYRCWAPFCKPLLMCIVTYLKIAPLALMGRFCLCTRVFRMDSVHCLLKKNLKSMIWHCSLISQQCSGYDFQDKSQDTYSEDDTTCLTCPRIGQAMLFTLSFFHCNIYMSHSSMYHLGSPAQVNVVKHLDSFVGANTKLYCILKIISLCQCFLSLW